MLGQNGLVEVPSAEVDQREVILYLVRAALGAEGEAEAALCEAVECGLTRWAHHGTAAASVG